MTVHRGLRAVPGLFFLILLAGLGCATDQPTQPVVPGDDGGGADFDITYDPGAGEFVLKRITVPDPNHRPIPIDLIGTNLRTDATTGTVTIDVAVRNAWFEPIYAPLQVWLSDFDPANVFVRNPDDVIVHLPEDPGPTIYIFDYTDFIPDGVLPPGATTEARPWEFDDPGLAPFSFGARARVGLEPAGALIGGRLFFDNNGNGEFDAGDHPYAGGRVQVDGPDGFSAGTLSSNDGRYSVGVEKAGLYSVRFESLLDGLSMGPVGPCYTTPNPLQVLLTVDEDGNVRSFLDADFGIRTGPCPQPPRVRLTDADPNSIEQDFYNLDWIELRGDILAMQVGFSGCGPDHPFELWAGRSFMESNPVQTWVLLQHDDLGEFCEAYWTRVLEFDLDPLRQAHIEMYGQPGVIILRFADFHGVEHRFEFGP